MKDLDPYRLIDDLATVDPIKEVLRKYKVDFPKDVLIGDSKVKALENLRRAVSTGIIPQSAVDDVLRDAEENGNQHIYYFVPRDRATRVLCEDGERVAELLFGSTWRRKMGFPKLTRVPNSYETVDFRVGLQKKPDDWMLKIYGFHTRVERIDRKEMAEDTFAIYYKRHEYRTILAARWNSDHRLGLLEIRVSRDQRTGRLPLHVQAVWNRLKSAFAPDDFLEWDLNPCRRRMVTECAKHAKTFMANSVEMRDKLRGGITYHPSTEHEPIHSAPIRVGTIRDILADGGGCVGVSTPWLADGAGGRLKKNLTTFVGATHRHELVIQPHSDPASVDYVTDQLRYFGQKPA